MISTEEAARRLDVSQRRVQELVRTGALKAQKVSRVWLVDEESVALRLRTASKRGGRPAKGHGKGEHSFTLMNRTHEVVAVVYSESRKEFVSVSSDCDARYAPLGILSQRGTLPLAPLNRWWRGRGIPQTRNKLASLLEDAGVELPEELIQRNLGLSLSDQYWIRPADSSLKWEDINFFNNDFDQVSLATSAFAVDGKKAAAKPDNTSDGNLEKKWVCRNGTRFLLKGGTQLGQEPYNEAVATALHRRLLDTGDYVAYSLEGEGPLAMSCCPNFLTDEEEFVPALYVERCLEQGANESGYDHFLACCAHLGVKGEKQALDRMIVCDDVIANHDRHRRNFGIVRNVETLECRPAPLFDSGSSLWCDTATADLAAGEHSFASKQFHASPAKQMLLVDDLTWFDAKSLGGFVEEAESILSRNEALASRLPYLISALTWRLNRMISIAEWA